MKKEIGILTINSRNIGNKLQNLALQEELINLGFDPKTLKVNKTTLKYLTIRFLKFCKAALRIILKHRYHKDMFKSSFKEINKKIIKTNLCPGKKRDLVKINNEFDYIVVGSDQVWNPNFNDIKTMTLSFLNPFKRVSYAASFGVTDIKKLPIEEFSSLKDFKAISVREKSGINLVEELSGKEATLVLDPTLLVDCSYWTNIAVKPSKLTDNDYVFIYFLGSVPKEACELIEKIKNIHNRKIEVININDEYSLRSMRYSPENFLYLTNNASIVLTDSFHGTVFSVLFGKPFVVFKRKGVDEMFTRIETLLSTFQLSERIYENLNMQNLFKIDYTNANKILEEEREKSRNFLINALN